MRIVTRVITLQPTHSFSFIAEDGPFESEISSSELSTLQGDDDNSFVEPIGDYAPQFIRFNSIMSKTLYAGVASNNVKLLCPNVGQPLPDIHWIRDNGTTSLSSDRVG